MRYSLTALALSMLVLGCEPMPPSGVAVCSNGRIETLCVLPSGGATDQTMIWLSIPSCGDQLYGAIRWERSGSSMTLAGDQPTIADRGGPAFCSPKDEALCHDAGEAVCEWWAVPQQDVQGTCLDLMTDEGATEADCYFPLARYPLSTVERSEFFLDRIVH